MVKLQCSIAAQDCPTLFSPSTTLHKLNYASGSCVRDARLTGNVGRCGFPGAVCVTDALGNDNCAYGGDSSVPNYKPLCQNGICGGGLGAKCSNGDYDCNWGYYCNTTASSGLVGTCGGFNAFVDSQGDIGVDFAFDYCLSGKAIQSSTGSWFCTSEAAGTVIASISSSFSNTFSSSSSSSSSTRTTSSPNLGQTVTVIGSVTRTISFTQPGFQSSTPIIGPTDTNLPDQGSKHHSSTGLIAGVVAGVVVVLLLLIIILILWRRSRRNNTPVQLPQTPQTGQFNEYTTEPLLAPHSAATTPSPSSQMQQLTGSTTPGFHNPVFTYLPEIQHDENAGGRMSYPTTGVPGGSAYAPTALSTTPTSPAFAYASSTGSSPPISPSPYASSHNAPMNMPYGGGGNLDATERHLLAARMEADRELAQMRRDGRDV